MVNLSLSLMTFLLKTYLTVTVHGWEKVLKNAILIDIGKRLPAFPVTPPHVRVRIRRFGGLSYRATVNLASPSESK